MRLGSYGRPLRPVSREHPITLPFAAIRQGLWETHDDHLGTDFGTPIGTPAVASEAGMIINIEYDRPSLPLIQRGWGNCVYLQAGNDLYIYGHLSEISVAIGQVVSAGQIIVKTGQSGNCHGQHLHWERRRVNPATGKWEPCATMFFDENGAYYA